MSLNRLVLVLNASYEAINITTAKRALKLVFKGRAVVEELSAHVVRTSKINVPIPSIIRLTVYRKMPRQNRGMSRRGILLRDQNTCQYCGQKMLAKDLTLDHVIPRSRGGESNWENIVVSCFPCNNKKGNRTPHESDMVLAKPPRRIGIHAKHKLMSSDERSWDKYLFVQ